MSERFAFSLGAVLVVVVWIVFVVTRDEAVRFTAQFLSTGLVGFMIGRLVSGRRSS